VSAAPVDERKKIIQATLSGIEKDQGLKFHRLGDKVNIQMPHISTGIWRLDHEQIGIGGVPRGRIVEIIGPSSSGKTTITLHLTAEAQKDDGEAAFVDAEHALDPTYAHNLGVDVDRLLVAQPDYGEQALQATCDLVASKAISLVVVDSVAALIPKTELEGEMQDATVGLAARMMAKAMRKLTGITAQSGTTVVFINQIREKIGVTFGSNETTTGGRALPFFASLRIDVRRLAQIKEGDVNAGNKSKIKIIKNKCAPPFREANFELFFGKGVDSIGSLVDCAVDLNVWKQKGSQYVFMPTGEMLVGKKNVRDELASNLDLYNQTQLATLKALGKDETYIKNVVLKQ
jgi:recombination protein RecA